MDEIKKKMVSVDKMLGDLTLTDIISLIDWDNLDEDEKPIEYEDVCF